MYYVGQKMKNHSFDIEPSFVIVKITESMATGERSYYLKDIDGARVQKATEDFLYPYN
jgi:hypothetical protein